MEQDIFQFFRDWKPTIFVFLGTLPVSVYKEAGLQPGQRDGCWVKVLTGLCGQGPQRESKDSPTPFRLHELYSEQDYVIKDLEGTSDKSAGHCHFTHETGPGHVGDNHDHAFGVPVSPAGFLCAVLLPSWSNLETLPAGCSSVSVGSPEWGSTQWCVHSPSSLNVC